MMNFATAIDYFKYTSKQINDLIFTENTHMQHMKKKTTVKIRLNRKIMILNKIK